MTLIPIDLPPGVSRNGTRYKNRNRFYETNRVRWHNEALRPIGGWSKRRYENNPYPPIIADPSVETVRNQHVWKDNLRNATQVASSNAHVYWIKSDGTYEKITPGGLPAGPNEPTAFFGYGVGPYGVQAYGTARNTGGLTITPVARWRLQNWGQGLLAMPDWIKSGGQSRIHSWNLETGVNLKPIENCPQGFFDFVVTAERFVMGVGDSVEARRVSWSDQEDFTKWTAAVTNQAGAYTLGGSGNIISCHRVAEQVLILTETDAHTARYIGPPYVYSFELVGENCKPLDRNLVATTADFAVWGGEEKFWIFDGQLRPLDSPLIDYVRETVNRSQISKSFTWVNPNFSEVWWHYVSNNSTNGECDAYVAWDWSNDTWHYGRLNRSSITGSSVLQDAHGIDHDGNIFWHELAGILPNDTYAITGPLEIGDGEQNMLLRRLHPDVEMPLTQLNWDVIQRRVEQGLNVGVDPGEFGVDVQFMSRNHPQGDVWLSKVYELRNPTPLRVRGREIMMRISGRSPRWEFGRFRLDAKAVGKGGR